MLQSASLPSLLTFTRASAALDFDETGALVSHPTDTLRRGFDPVTRVPVGWAIESAATNLLLNSQAGLTGTGTGTNAVAASPAPPFAGAVVRQHIRATDTAAFPDDNTGVQSIPQASLVASAAYVASVYIWLPSSVTLGGWARIAIEGGGAGVVTSVVGIDTAKRDQWQRVVCSTTMAATITSNTNIVLRLGNTGGAYLYTACPQFEAGSVATSYIPTTGSAATRAADDARVTGAAFAAAFRMTSRTNLVQGSESFDTGWTVQNATVTANGLAGPDGVMSADFVVPSITSGNPTLFRSVTTASPGQTFTMSVYARAGGFSWIRLSHGFAAGGGVAFFNILNGVLGAVTAGCTASITATGINGWYRCSLTYTATSAGPIGHQIYIVQGDNTFSAFSGDGSLGVWLWGAMYEVAPTTPAPNLVTGSPEVLAGYTKTAVTVSALNSTAPDGTLADKIVEDLTTAQHHIGGSTTASCAVPTVFSFYIKAAGRTAASVRWQSAAASANRVQADINLTTGAVTNVAVFGTATGGAVTTTDAGNGWWRVMASATTAVGGTGGSDFRIFSVNSSTFAGDGVSGFLLWGLNATEGAAAPSYVPLSALVSPYIGPTFGSPITKTGAMEGFVVLDAMLPQAAPTGVNQWIAQLDDGSGENRWYLFNGGGANGFSLRPKAGRNAWVFGDALPNLGFIPGTPFRVGVRWGPAANGLGFTYAYCVNGGAISSIAGPMAVGMNNLCLGHVLGAQQANGRIRGVWCSARAPSDARMMAATVLGADVDAALAA